MRPFVLLYLCTVSTVLFAQQNALSLMPFVDFQPKAHFVTSGEWPLKWISQTVTEEDQLQQVVFQNTSDRIITGFQLGWAIAIPQGCGVTETGVSRGQTHVAPYETKNVAPGQKVTVGPYHLSSDSITTFARRAHSPAVIAQVGIYRVQFADDGEMVSEMVSAFEQLGAFGPEFSRFPCQSNDAMSPDIMLDFNGHDQPFEFKYPAILVECVNRAGSWQPANSCTAYFPVCDDEGTGVTTMACVAYPRVKFQDSPTFEAATFSVAEVKKASTNKECLNVSQDWVVDARQGARTEMINGVAFRVFELGDAGMSQGLDEQAFRTFHGGKCYQLSIRFATASAGAFDAGTINEFTKEDWNEVHGRLRQALDSFRFLK